MHGRMDGFIDRRGGQNSYLDLELKYNWEIVKQNVCSVLLYSSSYVEKTFGCHDTYKLGIQFSSKVDYSKFWTKSDRNLGRR